MQVHVHTDRTIDGSEAFEARVAGVVESALHRSIDQVASVEVRLSDENADKEGGRDKRCLMEARLEGHAPIVVTHDAATVDAAVSRAADKLARRLEHTVGRRRDLARHRTDPVSRIRGA